MAGSRESSSRASLSTSGEPRGSMSSRWWRQWSYTPGMAIILLPPPTLRTDLAGDPGEFCCGSLTITSSGVLLRAPAAPHQAVGCLDIPGESRSVHQGRFVHALAERGSQLP